MNVFGKKQLGRHDLQKEATRARILEVARSHFERDGFDGANVRAIAADAGVAAGTVLLHFSEKRDLLHAALEDDLARTIARALESTPPKKSAGLERELFAVVDPFFRYYAARPQLSRTLLREALLAESPWRERFTAQVARVHAHVVTLIEDAKLRGEIAADTNAALLGASFFSFYYFALIGWVQGAVPDPAPLFQRMLAQTLRGMTTLPAVPASTQRRPRGGKKR